MAIGKVGGGWQTPRKMWAGHQPKKLYTASNRQIMNRNAIDAQLQTIQNAAASMSAATVNQGFGQVELAFRLMQKTRTDALQSRLDALTGQFADLKA